MVILVISPCDLPMDKKDLRLKSIFIQINKRHMVLIGLHILPNCNPSNDNQMGNSNGHLMSSSLFKTKYSTESFDKL